MWRNQKILRGVTLIAVALFFGLQAASYPLGSFAKAGAGMFPLIISAAVGLIGLVMLVQARFEAAEPARFNPKNIAIIMGSLIGFVLIAEHVNTVLAIVFLVFFAGMAGAQPSWVRNVKICVALIGIAAVFHYLLGLSLALV